jgi:hypothetical protein
MVYLYTCAPCKTGNHDKCEGSSGKKGYFGGRACTCSHMTIEDIAKESRRHLKKIMQEDG